MRRAICLPRFFRGSSALIDRLAKVSISIWRGALVIERQPPIDPLPEHFREPHFEKRLEGYRPRPSRTFDTVRCDHGPFVEPKNAARTRAGFWLDPKPKDEVI